MSSGYTIIEYSECQSEFSILGGPAFLIGVIGFRVHDPVDLHPHPNPFPSRERECLHFGEFEAFEVFLFEYLPGFVLVLFCCLLESVPVGFFVCFAIFPCVDVG